MTPIVTAVGTFTPGQFLRLLNSWQIDREGFYQDLKLIAAGATIEEIDEVFTSYLNRSKRPQPEEGMYVSLPGRNWIKVIAVQDDRLVYSNQRGDTGLASLMDWEDFFEMGGVVVAEEPRPTFILCDGFQYEIHDNPGCRREWDDRRTRGYGDAYEITLAHGSKFVCLNLEKCGPTTEPSIATIRPLNRAEIDAHFAGARRTA